MTDSEINPAGEIGPAAAAPGMSLGTLGMVLTLVSIACFFAALVIAYAFVLPDNPGKAAVAIPRVFWLSTVLLILSSGTLQWARRSLWRALLHSYRQRLLVTIAMGYLFLAAQMAGGWLLLASGVGVAGNPRGNMVYVFSFIHGLHLVGGLGGMHWLYRRAKRLEDGEEQPLRRHRTELRLTGMYWHFMGVLWIGLFAFLLTWN
jgi:cytochrome c oxidase subunit 3